MFCPENIRTEPTFLEKKLYKIREFGYKEKYD